jgi:Cu/Ag efflux pump CusA
VVHEAAIAAGLTGLMILLFLGSWRSTLIVVISDPLSILVSIIIALNLGETLNTMTSAGWRWRSASLSTMRRSPVENIHRNLHQRKTLVQRDPRRSAGRSRCRRSSRRCAICIVFAPVVFISGAAK